jgi:hypothetical protein
MGMLYEYVASGWGCTVTATAGWLAVDTDLDTEYIIRVSGTSVIRVQIATGMSDRLVSLNRRAGRHAHHCGTE